MSLTGLLLAVLALGLAPVGNAAPPKSPPARAEVERLVRRYYEGIASEPDSTKSDQVADAILSENFLFTFGNLPRITQGIPEHKRWLTWHHRADAGQVWSIQDLMIENGSAATRFRVEGSHQGSLLGVKPTGKPISLRGMDFFRIADGRIVELYRVFDGLELLRQIGVTWPPEAPATAPREP